MTIAQKLSMCYDITCESGKTIPYPCTPARIHARLRPRKMEAFPRTQGFP